MFVCDTFCIFLKMREFLDKNRLSINTGLLCFELSVYRLKMWLFLITSCMWILVVIKRWLFSFVNTWHTQHKIQGDCAVRMGRTTSTLCSLFVPLFTHCCDCHRVKEGTDYGEAQGRLLSHLNSLPVSPASADLKREGLGNQRKGENFDHI